MFVNYKSMKKYYARFIFPLSDCVPAKFSSVLFGNKGLERFYTNRYWIPQTMGEQVWIVFEFDSKDKRNAFLTEIYGNIPFLVECESEENFVFYFKHDYDKADFMQYVNPNTGLCN